MDAHGRPFDDVGGLTDVGTRTDRTTGHTAEDHTATGRGAAAGDTTAGRAAVGGARRAGGPG